MRQIKYIIFILFSLNPLSVYAAACCGGGAAVPSLITGDDKAQFTASISDGAVVGDAPAQGVAVFRGDGDSEDIEVLKLDTALLLTDRLQAGASAALSRRSRNIEGFGGDHSTGIGDITLDEAYEVLPEWEYNPWKPHGFIFLQEIFPTGGNIYESQSAWALDARGRGFYTFSLGSLWMKNWGEWDAVFLEEVHQPLPTTYNGLRVYPHWGATALLGGGVSPEMGAFRFGLALSPMFESTIKTIDQNEVTQVSESQLVWNSIAQVTYLFSPQWSGALSYDDQTLIGPAKNVTLSRTLALQMQYRVPR